MATHGTPPQLQFHASGGRNFISRFYGRRITSDGRDVLLRETDFRLGQLDPLASCFTDIRKANSLEHTVRALVAQPAYALPLGYDEDLNSKPKHLDTKLAMEVA